MAVGWWIAAALLVALMIQLVICKRLRDQRWRDKAEIARLNSSLSILRQELAEVNARRKKLLAASTQALIIVEKDYQISSANKVAKRLFGKLGKTTTLMAWTRQHQLQELVDQTLQGTKMPPLYFNLDDRSLEAHARVIKEHKQPVAVALAVHDVTELQHLSRIRRDLVTNISHELRTPLASLQLLTDTLLSGALDDKEMAPHLVKKIATQTDTLSQLAQEVLDLSMLESGRAPLRMAPCALKEIAQAQVDHLLPQAERKNLTLKIEIPDDITVLVDETMMGRVITNLVHNAIKFTERGSVTITAQKSNLAASSKEDDEGEWVTVSISDTGTDIPLDAIDRIFERFYKVDRVRDPQKSGTGLGLAIAKHIVEAHGGCIWAESGNGTGATFYFTLPAEDPTLIGDIPHPHDAVVAGRGQLRPVG